ncbi:selenide, water dikinase SelD [soil metagenome]
MQGRSIKLTQTVQKGGCAAKVSAQALREILAKVRFPNAAESFLPGSMLVDGRHFDDASVHKLTPDIAIVSTLDFFTPIVDSPRTFGAIAAANALSDVYAMGGRPLTALGILAFPVASFENVVVEEVMQGACDVLSKARATLSGGHSIDDDTLKFGLSVTGIVHPDRIWSNTGARAGDVLILTKALGTGTLTAALKREAVSEADIEPALKSMMKLNNVIDALEAASLAPAIHAATDITGFGLAGHSMQMAQASDVDFEFDFASLPILPGAASFIREGFLTKAHRTNRDYTAAVLKLGLLSTDEAMIMFDPQTSGGLLLSVEPSKAESVLRAISNDFPEAHVVGRVKSRTTTAAVSLV